MTVRRTSFDAIGTKWSIEVRDEVADDVWEALLLRIYTRIHEFDRTYSRFRADSLVSEMALQAGEYDLPQDGYAMLSFYERLYVATAGKVTPLIGQAITDAGYDADYSLQPKELHAVPAWDDVLSYNEKSVTLKQPALLDFGAVGKGRLVDIIGGLLDAAGVKDFTIDASGDIMHRSSETRDVGLENPLNTSEAIGIVKLGNRSLCASAGSKRQWGEFTHIIDPQKLASPRQVLATWAIADDTMTADGLATALFFAGPVELERHFNFSWAILNNDMSLERASDFPAEVFTAE